MKQFLVVLFVLGLSACGGSEEPPVAKREPMKEGSMGPSAGGAKKPGAAAKAKKAEPTAAETAAAAEATAALIPAKVEFQENDFSESERSRDPFRSFIDEFVASNKATARTQLNVVAKQYTIEELKLVAIVTRIEPPRAMFVDPSGKGHVVDHGDFIGKAEIIQGGSSSADYEIHWRVDRVRDNDVVLVREDPANPDIATATRVIPLRIEDQLSDAL